MSAAGSTGRDWVEVARVAERAQLKRYALVLQAMGIASASAQLPRGEGGEPGGWALLVRPNEGRRALEQLARYEEENRDWPPRPAPLEILASGSGGAAAYSLLLAMSFIAQAQRSGGIDWLALGRLDGARVFEGEAWRTVTALTLHGDLGHLIGNLFFGALFVALLCQMLGTGAALFSTLCAGALGNAVNAWLQPPGHLSIGASTAVFGCVGLFTFYQWRRRRDLGATSLAYRWVPLLAAGIFLGYLGMSGENTDILAHVTGLLAGGLLGWLHGLQRSRGLLSHGAQLLLGLAAGAGLVAAWGWALAASGALS